MVVSVVVQLLSAAIFFSIEPELSYFDAFYHSLITATTVGYGDVKLARQEARLFACFYIIYSVTFLAALINRITELSALRHQELKRLAALTTEFTPENLVSMDKD